MNYLSSYKLIKYNNLTFALLLIFITFGVYHQVLFHDFVYFDDDKLIFNNPTIIDTEIPLTDCFKWGFKNQYYKPFTLLSWRAEYQLFGENPTIFHLNNLILHILNSLLIYLITINLLSKVNIPKEKIKLTAFIISLLFAVHPLHVESVAWATERKDVLFSFFFLLSWLSYIMYLEKNKYFYVLLASVLYLFSVLSKSMGITLVAVLFLTDLFYGKRNILKMILEKIPVIFVFIVSAYFVGIFSDSFEQYKNVMVGDANLKSLNINEDWQGRSSNSQRFLIMFAKLFLWLIHIIFPVKLSVYYNGYETLKTAGSFINLFPFIIIGFYIWGVFQIKKHREILFGLLFFLVTISPALLTTDYGGISVFLSDRYTYIPLWGVCLIFGSLMVKIFRKSIVFSILVVVLLTFSLLSFNAVKVWKNTETLWLNVLQKSKNSVPAYNGLGFYYFTVENNDTKAIDALSKGINILKNKKLNNEPILHSGAYVDIYKNRALIYFQNNDFDSALLDFNDYLNLKPNDWGILVKRAIIQEKRNELNLALADLNQALKLNEHEAILYMNRGVIRYKLNDYENALIDLSKSIEWNDTLGNAYNVRSLVYLKLNDLELSAKDKEKSELLLGKTTDVNQIITMLSVDGEFEKAKEFIEQNENISEEEKSFLQLMTSGRALYNKYNYSEALHYFKQCEPNFEKYGGTAKFPDFLNSMAHCLLETNQVPQAKLIFERVAEENPKNYFSLKNLGFIAFQHEKNFPKAIQYYSKSLDADSPDLFQSYMNLGTLYLIQNDKDLAIKNYENSLQYGTSETVINNLFLLWQEKGNQGKVNLYESLMKAY
ncbi:MAG: tetratricopeptide repeat protein [Mariniphaga sp.]|nr:tetratricopeptide repeat protein [Mariniphaga sp.]